MEKKNFGKRYPDELRARAVRMVLDHESEYRSRSAAISSVSQKVGCMGQITHTQKIGHSLRIRLTPFRRPCKLDRLALQARSRPAPFSPLISRRSRVKPWGQSSADIPLSLMMTVMCLLLCLRRAHLQSECHIRFWSDLSSGLRGPLRALCKARIRARHSPLPPADAAVSRALRCKPWCHARPSSQAETAAALDQHPIDHLARARPSRPHPRAGNTPTP